ncbi:hypothetical protein L596_030566 [Steinernema carpocapsae]|uniref:Uncharacterized protein n=1 Tax=Steinernema carpocapsae TaxID=34508 RepID=A0A4U5LPR7_STECR|nr:hypothetical protein L596_030566 [Steinernema carpocapsae]
MFKSVVILCLCLSLTLAQDPAVAMANNIYNSFTNFFTIEELVKLENAIASLLCQGDTAQQIHANLLSIITQNVEGKKSLKALEIASQLKKDLGTDYDMVHAAVDHTNVDYMAALITDANQSCENGIPAAS